jgi:peptidyl-prolyl cis-trans isomerase C
MKAIKVTTIATLAILVSACDNTGGDKQAKNSAMGDVVATVNGKPITQFTLNREATQLSQRTGGSPLPEGPVLAELISRELLRQEAESNGFDKNPTIAMQLDDVSRTLVSQAEAQSYMNTLSIPDDEVKQEYNQQLNNLKQVQIRARHILVDNEVLAKDVISKAVKGEKFDELASKYSKDPSTKSRGGELGWFNPKQVLPAFSNAVSNLKDGEMTANPVQSRMGWHVIYREESRVLNAPNLETVKDQLVNVIKARKLQQHLAELQKNAKIEYKKQLAQPAPAAAPQTKAQAPAVVPTMPAPASRPDIPRPSSPKEDNKSDSNIKSSKPAKNPT